MYDFFPFFTCIIGAEKPLLRSNNINVDMYVCMYVCMYVYSPKSGFSLIVQESWQPWV